MTTSQLLPVRLLSAELRWSSGSIRRSQPEVSFRLGNPGRPAKEPTLLIVVADDSGSVIGPAGADPVSNRYEESRRAFEVVARRGSKHELGAVLHFDSPTSCDVPPTPLTRTGLRRLGRGLRTPHDAAGTSYLGPSLTQATRLAVGHPQHRTTLVILSDFELFDSNIDEVLTDVADFPGEVHAVVLGGTKLSGLLDSRVQVTPVTYDDAPGSVARAVFNSLTTYRPGSGRTPREQES
jgi:hypothetical protein